MRYARALWNFARECEADDEIYNCMKCLLQAMESVRELPVLLRAPSLSCDERVAIICNVVSKSSVFERFVRLVVKEQREELIFQIARCYVGIYCNENSLLPVKFTTAQPLDEELKRRIENGIAEKMGKNVELHNVVDSSIIGGFIYEADSRRLDASVSGQLHEISNKLVKQNKKLV